MDKLIYEVIPPPKCWAEQQSDEWTDQLLALLKRENIHTINLPEVVCETRTWEISFQKLQNLVKGRDLALELLVNQ